MVEKSYPKRLEKFTLALDSLLTVNDLNNLESIINNDLTMNVVNPQRGDIGEMVEGAQDNNHQGHNLVEFGSNMCESASNHIYYKAELQILMSTHERIGENNSNPTEMESDCGEPLALCPRPIIYSNTVSTEMKRVNVTSTDNIAHSPLIPAVIVTSENRSDISGLFSESLPNPILVSGTIATVSESAMSREIKYIAVYSKDMTTACMQLHNILSDCEGTAFVRFAVECKSISELNYDLANIAHPLGMPVHSEKVELTLLPLREPFPTSVDTLIDQCGKLPDAINYSLMHNVALGLEFLHNLPQPIIHEDLSARNVVISTTLQVKIADIDMVTPVNNLTQTPCSEASTSLYDAKTDIYSFGILAIQMFVGQAKLKGQAAVSEWVESHEYLENIGYFHPRLNYLISECINNDLQGGVEAADIVCQINDIAQWFPISSNHKQQWMMILQNVAESLLQESYDYNSNTAPYLDSSYEVLSVDEAIKCVSSETIHRMSYTHETTEASLAALSLSDSDFSNDQPLSNIIPPHHCIKIAPFCHLNVIHMYADYSQIELSVIREVYNLSLAVDLVHKVGNSKEVSGCIKSSHNHHKHG